MRRESRRMTALKHNRETSARSLSREKLEKCGKRKESESAKSLGASKKRESREKWKERKVWECP